VPFGVLDRGIATGAVERFGGCQTVCDAGQQHGGKRRVGMPLRTPALGLVVNASARGRLLWRALRSAF